RELARHAAGEFHRGRCADDDETVASWLRTDCDVPTEDAVQTAEHLLAGGSDRRRIAAHHECLDRDSILGESRWIGSLPIAKPELGAILGVRRSAREQKEGGAEE